MNIKKDDLINQSEDNQNDQNDDFFNTRNKELIKNFKMRRIRRCSGYELAMTNWVNAYMYMCNLCIWQF